MQDYIKLKQQLEILWQEVERMERENPEPGPGGTSDYTELTNKPSINGVELNGNKTLAQLGIASAASLSSLISQFDDLFAVDNVSVVSDGEYPTTIDSRLALHQPINLNNVNYYFFEESGVDYSYFAIDTSGAYPKISLAQLLKDSHRVVFYEFATDTVPTADSDNFITSGGVYTALAGKQDTLTTAQLAAANSGITSAKVTQYDEDSAALPGIVDREAKNIYHVTAISSSNNNVTFTVYLDGSVGIKTTASGASQSTFFFLSSYMTIQPGTYVLSGGISNSIMLYDGADTNPWKSTGEAAEKTFDTATNLRLCIRVNSGYTNTTEVIVKPMVCTKADYDISNTYVPYAPTNRELYVGQASYSAESANGSFSSLIHSAASYCGVDDSQEVNGFVVFTSSVTSENLIGFFNFKYLRNVVFSPVISNTITYSAQSQYGTLSVTGGTGPYKAVVKFI